MSVQYNSLPTYLILGNYVAIITAIRLGDLRVKHVDVKCMIVFMQL